MKKQKQPVFKKVRPDPQFTGIIKAILEDPELVIVKVVAVYADTNTVAVDLTHSEYGKKK